MDAEVAQRVARGQHVAGTSVHISQVIRNKSGRYCCHQSVNNEAPTDIPHLTTLPVLFALRDRP